MPEQNWIREKEEKLWIEPCGHESRLPEVLCECGFSETPIDRAFILRLYAIHEIIMDAARRLNVALAHEVGWPALIQSVGEAANDLDFETDNLEKIFAEVLTDEERGLQSDAEFFAQVEEVTGATSADIVRILSERLEVEK